MNDNNTLLAIGLITLGIVAITVGGTQHSTPHSNETPASETADKNDRLIPNANKTAIGIKAVGEIANWVSNIAGRWMPK